MVNWFGKEDYGPVARELIRRYFAHFSNIKIDENYKKKSFEIGSNYFDEEQLGSEEKQIQSIVLDFIKILRLIYKLEIQLIEKFNLLSEKYHITDSIKKGYIEDEEHEEKELDLIWNEFVRNIQDTKILIGQFDGFQEFIEDLYKNDMTWYHRKQREKYLKTPYERGENQSMDEYLDLIDKIKKTDENRELEKEIKSKIQKIGLDMSYEDALSFVQNFQNHLETFHNKSYLKKLDGKAKELNIKTEDLYAKLAELSKDIAFYKSKNL